MSVSSPQPQFLSGIDVSHFQQVVDWPSVASAGIAFAFAKATDGGTGVDAQFAANWAGMQAAGVVRGAYHFFRPATSAEAQADHFAQVVGALAPGDLPPVLDLEETATSTSPEQWNGIDPDARTPLVLTWLEQVEAALGLKPLIYTRRGFIEQFFPDPEPLTSNLLWVAHYTPQPAPNLPPGWDAWSFWQFSESGQVNGIGGAVDLDRFNGTLDQLRAIGLPAPPAPPDPAP
jgi:lysozyme